MTEKRSSPIPHSHAPRTRASLNRETEELAPKRSNRLWSKAEDEKMLALCRQFMKPNGDVDWTSFFEKHPETLKDRTRNSITTRWFKKFRDICTGEGLWHPPKKNSLMHFFV